MIQRVPNNWNVQQNEPFPEIQLDGNTIFFNTTIPTRELQWTVGGAPPPPLGAHGDGGVRDNGNPPPLPAVGGTLESVVNQAATNKRNHRKDVPWNGRGHRAAAAPVASSDTTSLQAVPAGGVDAMVPCNNARAGGGPGGSYVPSYGTCSATHADSCSADAGKGYPRGSGTSMTVSATFETESHQLTVETSQLEMMSQDFTFTTNSIGGSLGNTSSAANESASHSINETDGEDGTANVKGKSSQVSAKKNRAAAVHNQSERKRRDRINEKMRTLQRMVPNASKTDKASMLDEVIDYLKQLQAQINIMTRMPSLVMQQQLQLQLISMMGMGMNMGMGITGAGGIMPPPNMTEVLPPYMNPFMSPSGWEGIIGHGSDVPLQTVPVGLEAPAPHPFNVFLAGRQQAEAPNAMESAALMSALYQQFQQVHGAV